MKRTPFVLALTLAGLLSAAVTTKLTKDEQILHVLNRLTFGPRPGDIEEVRRIGIDKWIDLQLHPERIPENPVLEEKLKPFETLHMSIAEILKAYPLIAPGMMIPFTPLNDLLKQDQMNKIFSGTIEERKEIVNSLDPETRKKVLLSAGPQLANIIPEFKQETEDLRKAQQEERRKMQMMRTPQLATLLDPDQRAIVAKGSPDDIAQLLSTFDETKRVQIASAAPRVQLGGLPEIRRKGMGLSQPQQVVLSDLREAKVLRAVYSNRQLEEVLTDFWFNHFNVYEGKMQVRTLLTSYERDAIRPHVLGHFKDLLLAVAHHPAMLYYLDNFESIAPGAFDVGPFAPQVDVIARNLSRQAHGINENYGRELMELHTLGVDGGYTQADVIAVARCFTGWTVSKPATDPHFVFAGFIHDWDAKTVLGHTIPAGGGESDGLQVIDILAHHPSTAKFISKELAQRFVADTPPQALVDRMAQTFLHTDGDIRAVLATMFTSPEFYSDAAYESKLKSPFEMVVSAVRAAGDATDGFVLAQRIADLGEPLYGKLEPTGYPNTSEAWLNTAGLFARMNFAAAFTGGSLPGVKVNGSWFEGKDSAAVARALLGRDPSDETRQTLAESQPKSAAALVLSSPEFQKR
jgi:uncharacterized protein (DUF1800 family)